MAGTVGTSRQQHLGVSGVGTARARNNRRTSVSSECGSLQQDASFVPPVFEKSPDVLVQLDKIRGNLLFSELDDNQWSVVKNAMRPIQFALGSYIIKQGDEGDYFYVVETGRCDIYVHPTKKVFSGEGDLEIGEFKTSIGPEKSFGELALMYNQPRAATVQAGTDCVLWAVDRRTFRSIVMHSTNAKRNLYKNMLRRVEILSKLTENERDRIADAVKPVKFHAGDVIIREGDNSSKMTMNFYMIEEGEVACTKAGQAPEEAKRLGSGDYFGEIALLTDSPRQATVTALTEVRCVTIDRDCFNRLFGPLLEVLSTRMAMYNLPNQPPPPAATTAAATATATSPTASTTSVSIP
eukprot:gnl/Spiro4/9665_TR5131_c0_g1_i1.p1 gnl/Spiro4/9665_TR5131_c0_g1~~gnl/Spiro4/9665_TR5131_c0_g1_i1.p1  ORF type:complete len:389 (-),score=62.46 gnl/Spiro4/9665_TR5131_c0_g1_i1:59-1114(-)